MAERKQIPKLKTKKDKFLTNTLYHLAEEYRKRLTDESEIERQDVTDILFLELFEMVKRGELINMNINAPPTSGKSITGMAMASIVMKTCFKRNLNITDIDRDQHEFSKRIRDPEMKNTIRIIDEWNELEEGGENSTVEKALYDYFSDVMAQRYIHKISCSPKQSIDKNALIYLEVISTDKHNKINHCKIYYKIFQAGMEIIQIIGHVNIDVGHILQQKWYQTYRKRKFQKMDLILREGIFRPRVLEYAAIIDSVTTRLKPLTKLTSLVTADIVRNYIKMQCRETKTPQSIVGEELATREVLGILKLYKDYWRLNKLIDVYKQNNQDTKEILTMQAEIMNAIKLQEAELKRYNEINQKYNEFTQ